VEIGAVRDKIEFVLGRDPRIRIQQLIPTSRVKRVIEISFEEAQRLGHNYVGTEHLLLGLLMERESTAAHVLEDLGVTLDKVRAEIERLLVSGGEEPTPRVQYSHGDRVLVHDAEAPYRLWEGRVTEVSPTGCEIWVAGRKASVTAELRYIHPVPMRSTRDCPFCAG